MKNHIDKKQIDILILFLLVFILILSSCEKEIAVEPVSQEKTITGKVLDLTTGLPVSKASITITPAEGNDSFTDVSNDSGYFFIKNVPIYSIFKPYRVVISALGYSLKDTTVQCNCDTLDLRAVNLLRDPTSCQIQFVPPLPNFGIVTKDSSKDAFIKIKNPTALPIIITNIKFDDSASYSLKDKSILPLTLTGGTSQDIEIRFTAQGDGQVPLGINVFLDCDPSKPSSSTLNVNASGESPKCNISNPPINNKIKFKDIVKDATDSTFIVIQNISQASPLKISYNNIPTAPFSVSPAITPRSIPPGKNDTIWFYFKPTAIGDFNWNGFQIVTDGSCKSTTVDLSGSAINQVGYVTAVVFKWSSSVFTNPSYMYKGFRFKDLKNDMDDYNNFCGTEPNMPTGKTDSADFRFDGYLGTFGQIQAFIGLAKIGNSKEQKLEFNNINYTVSMAVALTKGCGILFKQGDVIVIKTRYNSYAIIRIQNFIQTIEGYDELLFDYIYPAN